MIQVDSSTKGKTEERNEDYFDYNDSCFAIADGATDKSGKYYYGKTGGEIVSRLVVKEALSSSLNGTELINLLNKKVYELYKSLDITEAIIDSKNRFTCNCIVVRIISAKLLITCLGDSRFRINGKEVLRALNVGIETKNSEERAKYIRETGDVLGSREHIMPLLLKEFEYQNNPDNILGFGVIDGTKTPDKFIETFEYQKDKVSSLELFTDGYFVFPNGEEIKDWENAYEKAKQEDPDRYKKYISTKSNDDRTVAIIRF